MPNKSTQIVEVKKTKQIFRVDKGKNKTFVIFLNGRTCPEQNIEVELIGEGAEAKILGILVGRDTDSFSLNTVQRHTAPHTTSDLLVRGVFFDRSKLKYRGLIEIAKDAQNASAFQQENNLVLSSKVGVDTRPELEIKANEVRCTHAATISTIEKRLLYYMRTRGLSEETAKELIIEGFLSEVVERIENKRVKKEIVEKVKNTLDAGAKTLF